MRISPAKLSPLELWAGTECTLNRVGDVFFDQLERTGHASRLSDLDLFAGLGIKANRATVFVGSVRSPTDSRP